MCVRNTYTPVLHRCTQTKLFSLGRGALYIEPSRANSISSRPANIRISRSSGLLRHRSSREMRKTWSDTGSILGGADLTPRTNEIPV